MIFINEAAAMRAALDDPDRIPAIVDEDQH